MKSNAYPSMAIAVGNSHVGVERPLSGRSIAGTTADVGGLGLSPGHWRTQPDSSLAA